MSNDVPLMESSNTIPAKRAFFVEALTPVHSTQLDILKLLAVAAMFLDHWNVVFNGGESSIASLIGRLAFPIFAIVFAINLGTNPARWQRAARRLFIAGILCQPFYVAAFRNLPYIHWYTANILFTFAVVAQALYWWNLHEPRWRIAAVMLLVISVYPLTASSFGAAGLLFLIISHACFYISDQAQAKRAAIAWWILLVLLNTPHPIVAGAVILFPWLSIEVSTLLRRKEWISKRLMPGNSFYWIYGGHLAVIAAITILHDYHP